MSSARQIRLYAGQQLLFASDFSGAWELGRQNDDEEGLFAPATAAGRRRLVIAPRAELSISRRHVLLDPPLWTAVSAPATSAAPSRPFVATAPRCALGRRASYLCRSTLVSAES
jgi:hypothetical protein